MRIRIDTVLMVAAVAAVAAVTYFVLEANVPQRETQLAPVVPQEPPIVVQSQAAQRVEENEASRQ